MNCIRATYETVAAKIGFRARYGMARYRARNNPTALDLGILRAGIKNVFDEYCTYRTAFGIGSYVYEIRFRLLTLRRAFPQYYSEISELHQILNAFDKRCEIVVNIDNVIQEFDDPFILFLFLQVVKESRN